MSSAVIPSSELHDKKPFHISILHREDHVWRAVCSPCMYLPCICHSGFETCDVCHFFRSGQCVAHVPVCICHVVQRLCIFPSGASISNVRCFGFCQSFISHPPFSFNLLLKMFTYQQIHELGLSNFKFYSFCCSFVYSWTAAVHCQATSRRFSDFAPASESPATGTSFARPVSV